MVQLSYPYVTIRKTIALTRRRFTVHILLKPGLENFEHYFADTGPSIQSYGFSSSYVWMWELDHKETWALKNWCLWTMILEKTLEIPLDYKEIKEVIPKGNQSNYSLEGLMLKFQYFGHLIRKTDLLEKTLMLGKTEGRRRRDDRGWDVLMASLT